MTVQQTPSLRLWLEGRRRSFAFAFRGMGTLWGQSNARIHASATACAIIAGALARLSAFEWALITVCISSVWMAEAMNTALEALADAAVPQHHPLVGAAKDVAACAVLITAVGAVIVGALVFGPRLQTGP
ncbi:MAG TPA: diacylglycerol kinase family protein [Polyangiaceae bacterium]